MALVVDKTGKITEKHLAANISDIKKVLDNNKKYNIQKKILDKISKVKIKRRIVA